MEPSGAIHQDSETPRFRWTEFEPGGAEEDDGQDVIEGLRGAPMTLPPQYFYDDRGSILFERITRLPEYYLTRKELEILEQRAPEIAELTGPAELIELGSGSARKTRMLIDAYSRHGDALRYLPVDVSAAMLKDSSRDLLDAYAQLDVWGLVGTYEQALAELPPPRIATRMVIFLGSTLGNLHPRELGQFIDRVRHALRPGGFFLVGADLQKPVAVLEAAYNDSAGVTAEFNLNMLRHLNRRFDGDFDPEAFAHKAVYDREDHRIEMHLVSLRPQRVALRALDLEISLDEGETIRTEISRKFYLPELIETFARHGFEKAGGWADAQDWYSLTLFRAA